MRIVFLPIRSTIYESFSESKVFNSLHDVFAHKVHEGVAYMHEFYLKYYNHDDRFDCDCYALTTMRYMDQKYDVPQIVGFVYFGLTKACMAVRLNKFFNN